MKPCPECNGYGTVWGPGQKEIPCPNCKGPNRESRFAREDFLGGRVTLYEGDCLRILDSLPENSVDSVVTDPPYGLQFMGKDWDNLWRDRRKTDQAYVERTKGELTSRARKLPDYSASNSYQMQEWHEAWARKVLRVLKPGAHLLAFSGTRTYHRMVAAIEDAGFEVRDQLGFAFGSGFPKSHDISKAIDKAAGVEREVVGRTIAPRKALDANPDGGSKYGFRVGEIDVTAPATDAARQWQGWGTALKPAWEPIVLARKPLSEATIAANVLKWGVGALNIDGCRVEIAGQRPNYNSWEQGQHLCDSCAALAAEKTKPPTPAIGASTATSSAEPTMNGRGVSGPDVTGKLDTGCFVGTKAGDTSINSSIEKSGKMLTDQSPMDTRSIIETATREITSSTTCSSCRQPITDPTTSANTAAEKTSLPLAGNKPGHTAPVGRWPANICHDGSEEVLAAFPESESRRSVVTSKPGDIYGGGKGLPSHTGEYGFDDKGSAARFFYTAKADSDDRLGSKHPTIKPVDLIQYLVRLVTPKGGLVLDPFAGTGTTGEACFREGMRAILIEREAEYCEDIRRRMKLVLAGPDERQRAIQKVKGLADAGPLFSEAAE